jgi:hypothetical protein
VSLCVSCAHEITKEACFTQYNQDKSIESFSDAKICKAFHQQYVIAGANKLIFYIVFMQMDLSSMSSGKDRRQGHAPSDIAAKAASGEKMKDGRAKVQNDGKETGVVGRW